MSNNKCYSFETGNSGKTFLSSSIKVVTGDLNFFYGCLLGASVKSHKAAACCVLSAHMEKHDLSWSAFLGFFEFFFRIFRTKFIFA